MRLLLGPPGGASPPDPVLRERLLQPAPARARLRPVERAGGGEGEEGAQVQEEEGKENGSIDSKLLFDLACGGHSAAK